MSKKEIQQRVEQFSNQVVKIAIELPKDSIGTKAKRELISSVSQASANINLARLELSTEAIVKRVDRVLDQIGKVKFWINLLINEGYLDIKKLEEAHKQADFLTCELVLTRTDDEKKIPVSYPGEWFLDD